MHTLTLKVGAHKCVRAHRRVADAQPTDTELEVYELTCALLDQAALILDDMSTYGVGASDAVRAAIRAPNDDQQQLKTWTVLCSYVRRLKTYYEFSLRLGAYARTRSHTHARMYRTSVAARVVGAVLRPVAANRRAPISSGASQAVCAHTRLHASFRRNENVHAGRAE